MKDYFFLDGGVYGSAMDEISRKCPAMLLPGIYSKKQKQRLEKIAKKHRCSVRWVKVGYDDEDDNECY
ncbi:hypothetical protein [Butyricicoccus porcorum]|uniref:Uncharacterized protein n=1 Tax=Butyricicoccus porcorum TaxID=1945634 RepID=A0A252F2X0_9FIRM|nr:hypothetical protein [Butyricicoccus porcorum]OUM20021.1 hypothetical protein CBW42_09770 [Butyricicoccus porcorum]